MKEHYCFSDMEINYGSIKESLIVDEKYLFTI
jgi:hypothetical protein